jgi:phosphopantetheine adenylyltransferase
LKIHDAYFIKLLDSSHEAGSKAILATTLDLLLEKITDTVVNDKTNRVSKVKTYARCLAPRISIKNYKGTTA